MITIAQAVAAHHRQEFHHATVKNADGTPARCRVNGKCIVWKTRPGEFRLPVKRGLKETFYITHENAASWHMDAESAANAKAPAEYRAIRLWGQQLGSYNYYIVGEQERAAAEGAPIDALYKGQPPANPDCKWVCVSDLKEAHPFRAAYAAELAKEVK